MFLTYLQNSDNFQPSLCIKHQEISVKGETKLENRAAFIPFPAPLNETLKIASEKQGLVSMTPSSSLLLQTTVSSVSVPSSITVDLHVTNLDQSIGAKEMKTLLTTVFKQHVMVTY